MIAANNIDLSLDDSQMVWIDDGARSKSFFCKNAPVLVGKRQIEKLKEVAFALRGEKNVRLCMHNDPDAVFHNMIVLEHADKYYRPHQHPSKGETFHIIEGSMAVIVFGAQGVVINASILRADENFIYRVDANTCHAVMPISGIVVYHESKPGPFTPHSDIFPSWAPEPSNMEAIIKYKEEMKKVLRI